MMYKIFIKRCIDVALSSFLIVMVAPVLLIACLVIFLEVRGSVIFLQTRPGINKKPFSIFKLKTMIDDDLRQLTDEERIITSGRWIRQFSIDELPQLFNVLKGDMSLVGPRPLLMEYNDFYSEKEVQRFNVRPGITGLAQVSGRNTLSWQDKLGLDVEYVRNISVVLDLKILFRTIYVVLFAKGFVLAGEDTKLNDKKRK